MSSKSTLSLSSLKEKNKDSIPCRIEFIKDLLHGKQLSPLVDFQNTDTEHFLNNKEENASGESFDTRIVLKKRYFDFTNIILQIGGNLKYIKSGTTGHTFQGVSTDNYGSFEYGIKIVPFPKKDRYGNATDVRRPENAEIKMIKVLSYFVVKRQTPHVVLPIGTFDTDISTFVNLIEKNVVDEDNEKYQEFVKKYKEDKYYPNVSVLISEWANRGDFLDFIRKNYKQFTPTHWKVFCFQIISVLAVIQSKYPSFRHNDLKANNLLVHKITKQSERFTYRVVRCVYKVPNVGYHLKMWDFDFACIPGVVDNRKVESEWTRDINVTPKQNRYYDLHYFFNTLIKKGFCQEIIYSQYCPDELRDFINRIVPKKYQKTDTDFIHKRGRILINDEYVLPNDILMNDPYFAEFRTTETKIPHVISSTNINKIQSKQTTTQTFDVKKYLHAIESPEESYEENINISKLIGGDIDRTKKESKKKVPKKESKKNTKKNSKKESKKNSKKVTKEKKPLNKQTKTIKPREKKTRTISEQVREYNSEIIFSDTTSD
jgi:hypothetical protein